VVVLTSLREPALSAAGQAGMVNTLNDALTWDIFPILYARHGLGFGQIGVLAALYPAVWAAGQWSPARRRTAGPQVAHRRRDVGPGRAALALVALGAGMAVWALAMAYPTLLTAVGDVDHLA
jgi:hypothetical protein